MSWKTQMIAMFVPGWNIYILQKWFNRLRENGASTGVTTLIEVGIVLLCAVLWRVMITILPFAVSYVTIFTLYLLPVALNAGLLVQMKYRGLDW